LKYFIKFAKTLIMIRQTIVPTTSSYTLQLQIPDSLIGKQVTVFYDEEEVMEPVTKQAGKTTRVSDIFKDCRVDLSNYKFNRDEANDYE
jgi:hypothetical protein